MTRLDRAKQFSPFNALRGYYDEIRKEEFIIVEKKELTDEQIDELNNVVTTLKKGDIVKIVYYDKNGYRTIEGVLSFLDLTMKVLSVIKEKIAFSEILKIERVK